MPNDPAGADRGGTRFNPAPGWPAGTDSIPGPRWTPDPQWPAAPKDWPFYLDVSTGAPVAPPTGAWQPPKQPSKPPPRRPRPLFVLIALAVAVVLVAGVGITIGLAWPVSLPATFAGGKLISPAEQYARDLADDSPSARSYPGKPDDYRDYLKHAYLGELDGPEWPVTPTEALVGVYFRSSEVSIRLVHFSVERSQWTPANQDRLVAVALGEGSEVAADGVHCTPTGGEDSGFFVYCVRIGRAGFWVGATSVTSDAIRDPRGLRQNEIAAEMARLR